MMKPPEARWFFCAVLLNPGLVVGDFTEASNLSKSSTFHEKINFVSIARSVYLRCKVAHLGAEKSNSIAQGLPLAGLLLT